MMQARYLLSPAPTALYLKLEFKGEYRLGRPWVHMRLLPEHRRLNEQETRICGIACRDFAAQLTERLSKVAP
jgi:hypothetical protein